MRQAVRRTAVERLLARRLRRSDVEPTAARQGDALPFDRDAKKDPCVDGGHPWSLRHEVRKRVPDEMQTGGL